MADNIRKADQLFLDGFSLIVSEAMSHRPHLTPEIIAEKVRERDRVRPGEHQGSAWGVNNLRAGEAWVHPMFATEVFAVLEIPSHEQVGQAYRALRKLVDGKTQPRVNGR